MTDESQTIGGHAHSAKPGRTDEAYGEEMRTALASLRVDVDRIAEMVGELAKTAAAQRVRSGGRFFDFQRAEFEVRRFIRERPLTAALLFTVAGFRLGRRSSRRRR